MKLKSANKTRPQISLTPLIDVVFILLIFFMLVTKMTTYQSLALYLSQMNDQTSALKPKKEIEITLVTTGKLMYQQRDYSLLSFSQSVPANTISKLNINIEFNVTAQQFVAVKETLLSYGYTDIEEWVMASQNEH
ncbi:biopolymer transporter ExbD [Shewanella gelidimarina]|uniref:ExbD/TolR family protein n=1 Tax=Shewanella gelidimarina TaxID=56813 RepID=UPI00201003D7|nr:biopolymer transporter ExbD [Shewanella gelidimarina]MCL1058076.1 biopolymer transporter ExbD [Shewanella gelidimarina]